MSAPRRDNSQSPDPTSGHGMGGSTKNNVDMVPNGQVLQDYDQWRSYSIYSHNGGFGSPQQPQMNYYSTSPYEWTSAPPTAFYGINQHTLFGNGPPASAGNSYYYNYFPPAPTNGSDYNPWTPTPSKHSEFYYPMSDSGYSPFVGTDIVGNGVGSSSGGMNITNQQQQQQQQQPANIPLGYLEHGVSRLSMYDEAAIPGGQTTNGPAAMTVPYGDSNGGNSGGVMGHHHGAGNTANLTQQHSAAAGEPKRKTWATIASQPAKPNSGGNIGGPLVGGKSKGRVPIGGVPGSAFNENSNNGTSGQNANENIGGVWASSPPIQSSMVLPLAGKSPQDNTSQGGAASRNGYRIQSTEEAVKTTPSIGGGFWGSTNSSSGGRTVKNATPQTTNGGGTSESDNGDYQNENDKAVVNSIDSKKPNFLEKADSPQKPQQPRPNYGRTVLDGEYNPKEFGLPTKGVRYFVIKSYSEDDIHRSIKYGIWCSTEHGNKRLDSAYREREGKGPVYLLFSVNGSGHFCGIAQMTSPLDYNKNSGVWAQDKWKGEFSVKWIYVKDVPNAQLRHIRLENNENKPVTNSRDTQEVPAEKGRQVLKIIHQYRHTTSLFDDFGHYEKRQEEENQRKGRRVNGDD